MTILELVYVKQMGKEMYYPVNELAIGLAKFRRCKSFTAKDLKLLRSLGIGFQFQFVTNRVPALEILDEQQSEIAQNLQGL